MDIMVDTATKAPISFNEKTEKNVGLEVDTFTQEPVPIKEQNQEVMANAITTGPLEDNVYAESNLQRL